jgi:general secretion pathway protein G
MKRKDFGFTLIELLVAMTIVAVLMGIALVSYQGAKKSARDGKRKADLEQIRSALEMCRTDTGSYPAAIYNDISCGVPAKTYLSGTPKDPLTSENYFYSGSANSYILCAALEITSQTVSGCGSCGTRTCNYKVTNP